MTTQSLTFTALTYLHKHNKKTIQHLVKWEHSFNEALTRFHNNQKLRQKDFIALIGADISNSNTKMPGTSYGLSAQACITGRKLAKISGSVCESCYWDRIEKFKPSVNLGSAKRTTAINWLIANNYQPLLIKALTARIRAKLGDEIYHRWHDGGDLQSYEHYLLLIELARQMPDVNFWLPTKELKIINQFKGELPNNFSVRLSAPKVDSQLKGIPINSSSVWTVQPLGVNCPAQGNQGKCGTCRNCWNTSIKTISYHKH